MTAKEKQEVHELYQEYYGNSRKKKQEAKLKQAIKERKARKSSSSPKISIQVDPGHEIGTQAKPDDQPKTTTTRVDLIREAQRRGIKYFRILTKDELIEVLSQTDQNYISGIIENAKDRWKKGWGTRKEIQDVTQDNPSRSQKALESQSV